MGKVLLPCHQDKPPWKDSPLLRGHHHLKCNDNPPLKDNLPWKVQVLPLKDLPLFPWTPTRPQYHPLPTLRHLIQRWAMENLNQ